MDAVRGDRRGPGTLGVPRIGKNVGNSTYCVTEAHQAAARGINKPTVLQLLSCAVQRSLRFIKPFYFIKFLKIEVLGEPCHENNHVIRRERPQRKISRLI